MELIKAHQFIDHALYIAKFNLSLVNDQKFMIEAYNARKNGPYIVPCDQDLKNQVIIDFEEFEKNSFFRQYAAATVFSLYNKIREIDFTGESKHPHCKCVEEVEKGTNLFVGEVAYFARNEISHFEGGGRSPENDKIKDKINLLKEDLALNRPNVDFIGLLELVKWHTVGDFAESVTKLLERKTPDTYKGKLPWR